MTERARVRWVGLVALALAIGAPRRADAAVVIEGFEDGDIGEYTATAGTVSATVSGAYAHDGAFGLGITAGSTRDTAWIYRDDIGGRQYTTVMRPGQIMGTNTILYRVVEAGLTIVLLSNTDKSNVDALASDISKVLLGTPKAAKF